MLNKTERVPFEGIMLTPQDNERLTRVGPGTPAGNLMRRYWLPAALSTELSQIDGPPVRVRLLGEDLIAFRDSSGAVGLVSAYCPHRRAPMFFGRNEESGLRCVYHGWKFDKDGTCVDMPSEPPDSLFKTKVTVESYPTWEGGGLVWTYMGSRATMPPYPNFEFVRTPETHRHVSKTFENCNYLQALEGGLDTAHSSFAHNMNINERRELRTKDKAPRLEVERTDYGFRYAGIRNLGDTQYVRVYHYVMPIQQLRGFVTASSGGLHPVPSLHGHLWAPIDDTHTFTYNFMYSYDPAIPITEEHAVDVEIGAGRGPDDLTPDFHLKKNLANDYMIDRQVQKTRTFTGISGINTQDFALQEGMGPTVDRSREHLGTTDRAIIMCRQLLLEGTHAVEADRVPCGADSLLSARVRPVDLVIARDADWQTALKEELIAKF
jgi:phenylpropionate dioxygenase-like ring-hydroxylating dioxygenase large terminal subunit